MTSWAFPPEVRRSPSCDLQDLTPIANMATIAPKRGFSSWITVSFGPKTSHFHSGKTCLIIVACRYAARADIELGRTGERSLTTAFQRQIQEDLRCFFNPCCFYTLLVAVNMCFVLQLLFLRPISVLGSANKNSTGCVPNISDHRAN